MTLSKVLKEIEGRIATDNINSIAGVINFIQVHADRIVPCERLCQQMNAYNAAFNFDKREAEYMTHSQNKSH